MEQAGWLSTQAQVVVNHAIRQEQFRARLLIERNAVFTEYNLTDEDIRKLESFVFDELLTDKTLHKKLLQIRRQEMVP